VRFAGHSAQKATFTGFFLFLFLAVNGPLTNEELHRLIDSLIPTEKYREELLLSK